MKYAIVTVFALLSSVTHAVTIPPTNSVPEPETWALLGIASLAAIAAKHFRKK